MCETTIWPETLDRWRTEGMPAGVDPAAFLGLDSMACINDLFEPSFGLEPRVVAEDSDTRTLIDAYGKTVQQRRVGATPPRVIRPGIESPRDWERLAERLSCGSARFNNSAAAREYEAARAADVFTAITPAEPMWFVIYLTMGYEAGLRLVARDPDLVGEMVGRYTDYLLAMLTETFARGYRFDALWFWSDLCYRGGMLFSPRFARRVVLPHWQRLGEFARAHEMHFMFHCDGNVEQLIPLLLEAGVNGLHPLEARAGNDVRVYKRAFGERLCLIGNIDADVLATNDQERVAAEVRDKVPIAAQGGGYIFHSDHSIPPTVSLDTYRFALRCAQECGSA